MKNLVKIIFAMLVVLNVSTSIQAKEKTYPITVHCEQGACQVYLNGQLVATETPTVIHVNKKTATSTMIFKFVKDGYEEKGMVINYNKDELNNTPLVYCSLRKKHIEKSDVTTKIKNDPTVTTEQASQQVSRDNAGATDMESTILRWFFDSDPRGARIYWRVISSVPNEVKNTNETYLTTTPLEETRGFNIQGLTYKNSRDVTIEIKVSKRGFEDQVKRFNVRQALDQQEISGFFELVPKESSNE